MYDNVSIRNIYLKWGLILASRIRRVMDAIAKYFVEE